MTISFHLMNHGKITEKITVKSRRNHEEIYIHRTRIWLLSNYNTLSLPHKKNKNSNNKNNKQTTTSLARSTTLEDTSWARLTIELTSWNLPDSQLCLESKTEPSVTKSQNYKTSTGAISSGRTMQI